MRRIQTQKNVSSVPSNNSMEGIRSSHGTLESNIVHKNDIYLRLSTTCAFGLTDSIGSYDEELMREILSVDEIIIPVNINLKTLLVESIRNTLLKGKINFSHGRINPLDIFLEMPNNLYDSNCCSQPNKIIKRSQTTSNKSILRNQENEFPILSLEMVDYTDRKHTKNISENSLTSKTNIGNSPPFHPALEEGIKVIEINSRKQICSSILMNNTPITKIQSKLSGKKCEEDYNQFSSYNEHQKYVDYYSNKSSEAYAAKKFDVAFFYSLQREAHCRSALEGNSEESEISLSKLYDSFCTSKIFDMHGLNQEEAAEALDLIFYPVELMKEPHNLRTFRIITGRGFHTKSKKSKIKELVFTYLTNNQIEFYNDNPGSFFVTL